MIRTVTGESEAGFVKNVATINLQTGKFEISLEVGKPNVDFPCVNFSSTVLLPNEGVLLFGGKSGGFTNQLWEFSKIGWKQIIAKGEISGRYGHSAVLCGNSMFVFGGYDTLLGINNDLFCYDIKENTWTEVKFPLDSVRPDRRFCHFSESIVAGSGELCVLVFGGRGEDKNVYQDTWIFTPSKTEWKKIDCVGSPHARFGTAGFSHGDEVFVLGGFDGKDVIFSDFWMFSMKDLKWCEIKSNKPEEISVRTVDRSDFLGRYFHNVVKTSASNFFIVGGRNDENKLSLYVERGILVKKGERVRVKSSGQREVILKDFKYDFTMQWLKRLYCGESTLTFQPELICTVSEFRGMKFLKARHAWLKSTILEKKVRNNNIFAIPVFVSDLFFKNCTFY